MGNLPAPRTSGRLARRGRALPLLLGSLTVVGVVLSLSFAAPGHLSVSGSTGTLVPSQNSSSGSDPPGSNSAIVCPSTGPVIVGVEWDCVAVLDLTEVALILVSIGIVAYVFRDSDQAELPGDSAEVPVTAEEWEAYREMRQHGSSRWPPQRDSGEDER